MLREDRGGVVHLAQISEFKTGGSRAWRSSGRDHGGKGLRGVGNIIHEGIGASYSSSRDSMRREQGMRISPRSFTKLHKGAVQSEW